MFLNILLSFFISTTTEGNKPGVEAIPSDSLSVYVFLSDECMISQFYTLKLTDLYESYHLHKVGLVGYFPTASADASRIKSFGEKYHLSFPLIVDDDQALARQLGITVTPEVAVWDHRSGRLIYRGRIDDSYVRVGKRKMHPQSEDLKNIIEGWIHNEVPEDTLVTQAIGCFINFREQ
jgi:peroxiredoxin